MLFNEQRNRTCLLMNRIYVRVIWVYLGNLPYRAPHCKAHPHLECAWSRTEMTSVPLNSKAAFMFNPASSTVPLTLRHYTGSLNNANQLIGTRRWNSGRRSLGTLLNLVDSSMFIPLLTPNRSQGECSQSGHCVCSCLYHTTGDN
jgi:hypothetical protein